MTVGAVLSVEATGQLPAVPHHGPPCQHARKKRRGPSDRRSVCQALSGGGALAERRPRTGRDIQALALARVLRAPGKALGQRIFSGWTQRRFMWRPRSTRGKPSRVSPYPLPL